MLRNPNKAIKRITRSYGILGPAMIATTIILLILVLSGCPLSGVKRTLAERNRCGNLAFCTRCPLGSYSPQALLARKQEQRAEASAPRRGSRTCARRAAAQPSLLLAATLTLLRRRTSLR